MRINSVSRNYQHTVFVKGCGVKIGIFSQQPTIGDIFDRLWNNYTQHIVTVSNEKNDNNISINDVNLFLASILVMGLSPQPAIEDYFANDSQGIFGNLWIQQHFSRHSYNNLCTSIHITTMI